MDLGTCDLKNYFYHSLLSAEGRNGKKTHNKVETAEQHIIKLLKYKLITKLLLELPYTSS